MSLAPAPGRAWLSEQDCDLDAFRTLVERTTDPADHPYASGVERNVLVHDSERLRAAGDRRAVRAELVRALADGPSWPRTSPPRPGSPVSPGTRRTPTAGTGSGSTA